MKSISHLQCSNFNMSNSMRLNQNFLLHARITSLGTQVVVTYLSTTAMFNKNTNSSRVILREGMYSKHLTSLMRKRKTMLAIWAQSLRLMEVVVPATLRVQTTHLRRDLEMKSVGRCLFTILLCSIKEKQLRVKTDRNFSESTLGILKGIWNRRSNSIHVSLWRVWINYLTNSL